MKKIIFTIHFFMLSAAFLLMLPFSVKAQEPDWLVRLKQQKWMRKVSNIKLLQTNRSEAERILGKPNKSGAENDFMIGYAVNKNGVALQYTTKECTSVDGRIPKGTVEEIFFTAEENISFSNLKIPLDQFTHSQEHTLIDIYMNKQSGVIIYVQNKRLHSIQFEIPEQKDFSCVTVDSFLNDFNKAKQLKLLESNRDEVRKVFSGYFDQESPKGSEYYDKYYTNDATFNFSYSPGNCQFINSEGYNTAEWNVENIRISLNNSINPGEFGIDLTKYKKEKMYSNLPDYYVYYDKNAGIIFQVIKGKIDEINLFPPPKYNSLMCDKEQAKTLSSTESLFAEKLEDRIYNSGSPAYVEKLYLNQNEITIDCDSSNKTQGKNCPNSSQTISVFTLGKDAENDVLTYNYKVSAGKIIGQGSKVVWDLSGVKAGIYTISAAVDDGCGFCGSGKTKTITVK